MPLLKTQPKNPGATMQAREARGAGEAAAMGGVGEAGAGVRSGRSVRATAATARRTGRVEGGCMWEGETTRMGAVRVIRCRSA